jgi:hypothetical protein
MPPDQQLASSAMERLVVQEIGVKLTGILKENTPGRICGLLTARGLCPRSRTQNRTKPSTKTPSSRSTHAVTKFPQTPLLEGGV